MGLKNATVDSKGIIALLSTPFAFVPVGIGATQLPGDEQAIVATIGSLSALLGPLLPIAASGTGITVPLTLNHLWLAPVTGNDANDGLTVGAPIRTWGRVHQILGSYPVFGADFTLHVTEATTESFVVNWGLGAAGIEVEILGSETLFGAAHVLTAVANRVRATNTRQSMTEGATNWATSLGKIASITTAGARLGSRSICLLNPGAGVCTMATWALTTEATITAGPTETPPIIGDTVEVVDSLASTGDFSITITGLVSNTAKFFLRGFRFSSTLNQISEIISDGQSCYMVDCVVNNALVMQNVTTINCLEDAAGLLVWQPSALSSNIYGGAGSATLIGGGANVTVKLGFVQVALGLLVSDAGTYVQVEDMAVYDWTAAPGAVTVRKGADMAVSNAAAIWGTTAAATTPVLVVTEDSEVQNNSGTTFILAIPALGQTVPSTLVRGNAIPYPTDALVPSSFPRLVASCRLTGTGGGGTIANVSPAGSVVIGARNGVGDYQLTIPSLPAAQSLIMITGHGSAASIVGNSVDSSNTSKRIIIFNTGVGVADDTVDIMFWQTL